jgi:hypothetical protein
MGFGCRDERFDLALRDASASGTRVDEVQFWTHIESTTIPPLAE